MPHHDDKNSDDGKDSNDENSPGSQSHIDEIEKAIKIFNEHKMDESRPLIKNLLNMKEFVKVDTSDVSQIDTITKNYENKLKLNQLLSDSYIKLKQSDQVNGWSKKKTENIKRWKNELEYRWVVNYFFVYDLKKAEGSWSWIIIVISTITSALALIQFETTIYSVALNAALSFFSIITTLIAAWIKKQTYIERIKEIDRYIQSVGITRTDIDYVLSQRVWDRITYQEFIDRYQKQVTDLMASSPPMSPAEYKTTIYRLSRYYPELILDMYPWFVKSEEFGREYYKMTSYGKEILSTYDSSYNNWLTCCVYYCCNICCNKYSSKFKEPNEYNYAKIEELRKQVMRKKFVSDNNVFCNSLSQDKSLTNDKLKNFANKLEGKLVGLAEGLKLDNDPVSEGEDISVDINDDTKKDT